MNIFKLMFHVVISDTHSPQCIDKSYEHTKKILNKYPFVDTIVLNGDILTSTAMTSSNLHRNGLTNNDKEEYLKAGSPIFYGKWKKTKKITYEMVFEYINERYDWLYQVIENFAKLKRTIFNLGNHESEHQLLIFGELSMLTNSQKDDIPIVDTIAVKEIVKKFEKSIAFPFIDLEHIERALVELRNNLENCNKEKICIFFPNNFSNIFITILG